MTRSYPDSWDPLIDAALPARVLPVKRDALVHWIADSVRRWKKALPEIVPHTEKIRMLTAINDRLKKAIEDAGGELRELGVFADIRRITTENAELGIDPPSHTQSGRNATVDLYHVAHQAIDGLRRWKVPELAFRLKLNLLTVRPASQSGSALPCERQQLLPNLLPRFG
jgi:hypothetical protein